MSMTLTVHFHQRGTGGAVAMSSAYEQMTLEQKHPLPCWRFSCTVPLPKCRLKVFSLKNPVPAPFYDGHALRVVKKLTDDRRTALKEKIKAERLVARSDALSAKEGVQLDNNIFLCFALMCS